MAKEVEEPRTPGQSVYDDWAARSGRPVPPVDRLGGDYDYEVWIDHLGIPTIQMVFDYIASGNYHSTYDDLYFMEHWGDPGYLHHAAAARLAGIAALRLANADILPFQYSRYAAEVSGYLNALDRRQVELYGQVRESFALEVAQAQAWQAAGPWIGVGKGDIDSNLDWKSRARGFFEEPDSAPQVPEADTGRHSFAPWACLDDAEEAEPAALLVYLRDGLEDAVRARREASRR